jgi:hypothetical protein
MHVHNLVLEDYFNLLNAAAEGGPPGPGLGEADATVSFDVVWGGPVTRRVSVRDAANGYAGRYAENQATINWSGSNDLGFTFTANSGNFSTSVPEAGPFAELGIERNGIFFPGGGASPSVIVAPPANPVSQDGKLGVDAVSAVFARGGTDLALRPVSDSDGQLLSTSGLKNGSASDAASIATAARTGHATAAVTALFSEIGGDDILFR